MIKFHIDNIEFKFKNLQDVANHSIECSVKEDNSQKFQVCLVNSRVWYQARNLNSYRKVLQKASYVLPDGWPLKYLSGSDEVQQIRGIDLFEAVMKNQEARHIKFGFIGSNKNTLEKLQKTIDQNFDSAIAASYFSPNYGEAEKIFDDRVKRWLLRKEIDFLWIGLGAPKQDIFADIVLNNSSVKTAIGIGYVFDYLSGNVKEPPLFIKKYHLEWLYRCFCQPKRIKNFLPAFFCIIKLIIRKKFK